MDLSNISLYPFYLLGSGHPIMGILENFRNLKIPPSFLVAQAGLNAAMDLRLSLCYTQRSIPKGD